MIEFTEKDIEAISSAVFAKLEDLAAVYKRNVNSNPDYAEAIAGSMFWYLQVIERICPGYEFVTDSPSLRTYLYGSRKLEVVDG